nr:MAG TPA: hypothetical protein [Caudoviricetes sp.]
MWDSSATSASRRPIPASVCRAESLRRVSRAGATFQPLGELH